MRACATLLSASPPCSIPASTISSVKMAAPLAFSHAARRDIVNPTAPSTLFTLTRFVCGFPLPQLPLHSPAGTGLPPVGWRRPPCHSRSSGEDFPGAQSAFAHQSSPASLRSGEAGVVGAVLLL